MKRWMLILSLLCLLGAASACADSAQKEDSQPEIVIHYVSEGADAKVGDAVCAVDADLELAEDADSEEKAGAIVQKLMESPEQPQLRSPIPDTVELLDVTVQGRRAYVDFSEAFNRLSGVDLTLANSCLVLSLSQMEGINSVAITVEGRPVVQQAQQVFYDWNVLLSSMEDVLQTRAVMLYFPDESGNLIGEERVLEVYEGQFVAENLVLELLDGPEDRALTAIFPQDFLINSVRVESGICRVNLPAASLELLPEDEAIQRLMLHSLAYSLYSLENVQQLHLLADGELLEYFGSVAVADVTHRPGE